MKRQAKTTVRRESAGKTLLEFVAGRFTYHTADEWRNLIALGRVQVDGRRAEPDALLSEGVQVEYLVPHVPEPPVPAEWGVVHEDADLLAVNKPPGLPCHPAGRFFLHTLWAQLRQTGRVPEPIFVNRLDRETSGIVLVARNPGAARAARVQFEQRTVEKRYRVVVEGLFPPALTAAGSLVPDDRSSVRKKIRFVPEVGDPQGAQWAVTRFRCLRHAADMSLLEAIPETGRLHQIRATLQSLGFPVTGDKLYGVDDCMFLRFIEGKLTEEDHRRLRLAHQALHAAELRLRHPRTGHDLCLAAPMPDDMADIVGGQ